MFDDLRSAFREAYENFNKELNREHVPETVNRLIGGLSCVQRLLCGAS